MEWFVRAFVKASVVWLALGMAMGLAMAIEPAWTLYRPAHLHMTLLGFVSMMIFGVAYHVLPRFTGNPLHAPRLAGWHWWLANAGLALMVAGFSLRPHALAGIWLVASGGVLSLLGGWSFAYNVWRTLDGAPAAASTGPAPLALARGGSTPAQRRSSRASQ